MSVANRLTAKESKMSSRDNPLGTWAMVPSGQLYSAGHHLVCRLQGHAEEVILTINDDPGYLARIASFAISTLKAPGTSAKRAKEIMGKNFFGYEDATFHFPLPRNIDQEAFFSRVPFKEETLFKYRETHFLVAIFPVSLIESCRIRPSFMDGQSFEYPAFTNKCIMGWRLISKKPLFGSKDKGLEAQSKLIIQQAKDFVLAVPETEDVIYTMLAHDYVNVESGRMFSRTLVRTQDGFTCVGHYQDKFGMCLETHSLDEKSAFIGLAWEIMPDLDLKV